MEGTRSRGRQRSVLMPRYFHLFLFALFPVLLAAQHHPDSLDRRRLRTTLIAQGTFFAGGMTYLYTNWYLDRERVPFHFYQDAAGYKQVDKVGHAYGAYLESYAGYRSLRWSGVPKGRALLYGGGLGLFLQTPIEVFDGLYEGWGFSWSDMAANAFGAGLVIGQEALFDEQIVRMKFSFARSEYARNGFGYLGDTFLESLLEDYNGHTYWLSVGVNRILPTSKLPPWLNVAVGYGAGGLYGEFENRSFYRGHRLPDAPRHRQFYLSLDVDWTKIPVRSRLLRGLFEGLNFIKIPFPALEYNTAFGWRGHGVYF